MVNRSDKLEETQLHIEKTIKDHNLFWKVHKAPLLFWYVLYKIEANWFWHSSVYLFNLKCQIEKIY